MKITKERQFIENLRRRLPFDRISASNIEWFASHLEFVEFSAGETVLSPGEFSSALYFIGSGVIRMEAFCSTLEKPKTLTELEAGEFFPLEAMEENRPVFSTFRVKSPAECYRLQKQYFIEFKALDKVFADFCNYQASNFLDQSRRVYRLHFSHQSEELQRLDNPLSMLMNPQPLTARAGQTVREVVVPMYEQDADAAVVVDAEARPVGIFTIRDLLRKVVMPGVAPNMPVEEVMTSSPRTLPVSAMGYEATRMLAEAHFHHVVVVNDGRLAGIIGEHELFNMQRVSQSQINAEISGACNVEQLKECHGDIRLLSESMLHQGVKADQMTLIISSLNDKLISRTIQLKFASEQLERFKVCWVAMGSEGRHEQTLTTDQDNGIIFMAPTGMTPETAREILLPLASRVNHALAYIGFPLCEGNVMAMNPKCCLSFEEWQSRFVRWINEPTPDALLGAATFFDFRHVHGDVMLSDRLRGWLADAVHECGRFLHLMVGNALQYRPTLGFFRDFAVEDHPDCPNSIDIKANGVNLFVDAARVYALAHGVTRSNTRKRLQMVGDHRKWPQSEVNAWVDAFSFLQSLRLKHHFEQFRSGMKSHNRLNPYKLNDLDRKIVLESLRQAEKLQKRMSMDFAITNAM